MSFIGNSIMNSGNRKILTILTVLFFCMFSNMGDLHALGSYSRGRKIIKLVKFESRGFVKESWEGVAIEPSYDDDEKCDKKKNQCYTPIAKRFKLSVRPKRKKVVNFMRKNIGREMLVIFRYHKFEPVALSSNFEVLDVYSQGARPPSNFKRRITAKKSGTINFSLYVRILSLEKRGIAINTYEGLFLDVRKGKSTSFLNKKYEDGKICSGCNAVQAGIPCRDFKICCYIRNEGIRIRPFRNKL